jgi:hypothetical protein
MIRNLLVAFTSFCMVGCGIFHAAKTQDTDHSATSTDAHGSIVSLAKAFANAKSSNNAKAIEALYPSDELFESFLKCPVDDGPYARMRKNREDAGRNHRLDGGKLTFVAAKKDLLKSRAFKAGEALDECEVLQDMTWITVDLVFEVERGGTLGEAKASSYLGKFAGRWYLLGM